MYLKSDVGRETFPLGLMNVSEMYSDAQYKGVHVFSGDVKWALVHNTISKTEWTIIIILLLRHCAVRALLFLIRQGRVQIIQTYYTCAINYRYYFKWS